LLLPTRLLVLGFLVDCRAFGINGAGPGFVLLPGFIESRLSLRDRLLPALAFPLSGGFFPPAFGFRRFCSRSNSSAAFLAALSLIFGEGLFALEGALLFALEGVLSRLAPTSSPPRSGKLASSPKRPFEPAGRLSTTPGFDMVDAEFPTSSCATARKGSLREGATLTPSRRRACPDHSSARMLRSLPRLLSSMQSSCHWATPVGRL
jgi:hypothetical protein